MRIKQVAIFAAVAAIGGILAYIYPTEAQERSPVKLISTAATPPLPEARPVTQAASAPAQPAEDSMAQMFAKTRNMRAFVEYAKQHPEKGGYAYAMKGLEKCYNAKQLTDALPNLPFNQIFPSEAYAARQKAFTYLQNLCQGLSKSDFDRGGGKSLREEGLEKNDPVVKIMTITSGISSRKDPEGALRAKNQILQAIFTSYDPILISDYGIRGNAIENNGKSILFLNGKSYLFASEDGQIMFRAWRLAACELGGDCSATNEYVVMACIMAAHCHQNLADLIKDELDDLGDKDGQWFQRAVMYARQIVDAIRRGDLQAFRPPV